MYKYLLSILLTCSITTIIAAPITITVQNQYEAAIGTITLTAANYNQTITSNKDGLITIDLPNTDSVTMAAPNCTTTTFAVANITNGSKLALHKNFSWKDLINPMFYIIYGGLWLLLFIIFAETGLFAGFFLPGDSLLFVAGIYSQNLAHEFLKLLGLGNLNNTFIELTILIALIAAAGIVGNFVGYWFGRKVGPAMFTWKDKFLFKQKYLLQAQEFYTKNGAGAIVAARFIPIVRTFAPIVAGIVNMPKAKFTYYNIVGCIAWVASMILIGHFLNEAYPSLKNHLELIVIGIVVITTLPVLIKMFSSKKVAAN